MIKKIDSKEDFERLFGSIMKLGFSRVFIETGLTLTNFLINNKFIDNIYIFKTNFNLNKNGSNNSSNNLIKKIKLKNRLKVNLHYDKVFLERLK